MAAKFFLSFRRANYSQLRTVESSLPANATPRSTSSLSLSTERDRALGEKRVMERERDREREEKRVMERERDREREEKRVMERERDREREEKRVMERERERVRVELQRCQARANQLQERLEEVERREHEKVVVQEQAIAAEQRGPSWEVMEDELEETEEELGCGGWAKVKVAKLKVAAKCLHGQLIYDYHRQLFRREMDVAARVSHPNLLRFLGARLEGGMAILTEFMPTSLRALVNRRPRQRLPLEHVLSIAIDVARALNYLHNMSPDPIIHRDLSSANVLLQPSPDGGWLAKVSDYGTANFQSQLQTVNPGSPVYTAPESHDPALQTPKMDIYSFGVLLVEMYTCDFPAPERRAELMESIDHPRLLNLIRQCLNVDRDRRPTAAQLVDLLHAMQ
ncbi:Probable tyrosine-protein kinase DDB_G0283397 [Geodia barretti]|uniref:Probable tyrosine-protein kinase DDB_G0283397 n=2 Tax=Geodia barretti TaxID=519541 RepID=A0AA35T3I6_GEOBA|nr:Probable tyrosine-protein kinase DDB_G0283397 [Geodia barretti]